MYPDIGADAVAVEVDAFAAGDGEELGLGDASGAHDGDGFAVADYGCAGAEGDFVGAGEAVGLVRAVSFWVGWGAGKIVVYS